MSISGVRSRSNNVAKPVHMPEAYETAQDSLRRSPATWLITGAAGFIGSHLAEALLRMDQKVIGLDNLVTGRRVNLDQVRSAIPAEQWKRFQFVEGDICDFNTCQQVARVDYVLHHA